MAQELRFIRGDTYDVVVNVTDKNGAAVDLLAGEWNVAFESDVINKNSVDDPQYFNIQQPPYYIGQVAIGITSTDTTVDDCTRKRRFKIKLYKTTTTPAIIKTVVSGDLFFIDEA